jgi:DNA invertase Pin-like site-specific DNA recombinase
MSKKQKQRAKIEEGLFAFIYARVSTKKQFDTNGSIETQLKYIYDYATRNSIEIVEVYGSTYESAKTDDRKEFNKMIYDAKKNPKINTILVYDLDRFSRSGAQGIVLKDELFAEGIQLISVTQPIDISTDSGILMQDIHMVMNKYENMQRKKRAYNGIKNKLEQGICIFITKGYSKVKETANGKVSTSIYINKEGESIRKAFEWKAYDNLANSEILFKLRTEEKLNLSKQALSKIFRNPYYKGYIKSKYLGDRLVKAINYEPLVSEELFDLVNDILTSKNYAYKHERVNDDYPLKRHVYCAQCGTPLTAYKQKGIVYYKCNTIGCCKNYNGEGLHCKYVKTLSSYSIADELKPAFSIVLKDLFSEWNITATNQQKQYKTRITEIDNKINGAKLRFGCGEIDKDIYETVLKEFEPQKRSLTQKLEIAQMELSNFVPFVDYAISMSCKLGELWKECDMTKREKLQNLVFPQGVFYDKEIGNYRTPQSNTFFRAIKTELRDYKNKKEGQTENISTCPSQCG